MSDYVYFEYTAVVHLSGNPQVSGAAIHCLAKMRARDSERNTIATEDLKKRADDIVFVAISPGPQRVLSGIEIWRVDEGRVNQLGDAVESKSYAEGTVYRYEK